MSILYADDDLEDIEVFKEALNEIDPSISFIAFSNGDDALGFLEAELNPDFIFLDINMPELSGMECLKIIRSNPDWDHLPIIMFSTSIQPDYSTKYKKLNAKFVTKPNTYKELLSIISHHLKRH